MLLRNKKTGEVKEFNEIFLTKTVKETNTSTSEYVERTYHKIAELNEDWEDYVPTEPLIKDEKIRKAVRAWAEANNAERIAIQNYYCLSTEGDEYENIAFTSPIFNDIDDDISYTITELCGEEVE